MLKNPRLENEPTRPGETHLVLSYAAMRDLYFLLNQNKTLFGISENLRTIHRLLGIAYRESHPASPIEDDGMAERGQISK